MPKAYIAAAYTTKLTNHSPPEITDISYIHFLESIEATTRACGFETVLPHRDMRGWGKIKISNDDACKKSFEILSSSDVLIAYPSDSVGANIELGWAAAMKKKILILLNEKEQVSIMQSGLSGVTDSEIIKFRDIMDLKEKLRQALKKKKGEEK